jgi:hypothetical protein
MKPREDIGSELLFLESNSYSEEERGLDFTEFNE